MEQKHETQSLTPEQSEKYFYAALSNGGLSELSSIGIELDFNGGRREEYKEVKSTLKYPESYFEDVLMQLLRNGKAIAFYDEGEEITHFVTLEKIHQNVCKTPEHVLQLFEEEQDDAFSGFELLQSVLYDGEILFS